MEIHTYKTNHGGSVDLCEDCAAKRERAQSRVRPVAWREELQRRGPADLCASCGAFVCESCEATVGSEDAQECARRVVGFGTESLCASCADEHGKLRDCCDECDSVELPIVTDDGQWCSVECQEKSESRRLHNFRLAITHEGFSAFCDYLVRDRDFTAEELLGVIESPHDWTHEFAAWQARRAS
jgi:hypothetical protein